MRDTSKLELVFVPTHAEFKSIEFCAEFFHLFNHASLTNRLTNFNAIASSGIDPNAGEVINPVDFGRIISTSNNRD